MIKSTKAKPRIGSNYIFQHKTQLTIDYKEDSQEEIKEKQDHQTLKLLINLQKEWQKACENYILNIICGEYNQKSKKFFSFVKSNG